MTVLKSILGQIDRQDVLLIVGCFSFLGGIAALSRSAAAIVGGLLCFLAVWMIERSGKSDGKVKGADGSARK